MKPYRRISMSVVFLVTTAQLYVAAAEQWKTPPTWYERIARQINPGNIDYGSIWEQRKQDFINQLRNPYFRYAFAVTVVAILLLTFLCALYIRHRRTLELLGDALGDIWRHD